MLSRFGNNPNYIQAASISANSVEVTNLQVEGEVVGDIDVIGNIDATGYIASGTSISTGGVLTDTKLDFQSATVTQAAVTASANTLTFEGVSSANCLLSGLVDPVTAQDAATKNYVDTEISSQGIHWKCSCRVTDAGVNVPLPATLTIDGVTITVGDRALLRNQSTALENGVYVVNGSSQLERAADMPTGENVANFAFYIEQGDTLAGFAYVITNDYPNDVVDTDVLLFGVFSGDPVVPGGTPGVIQYNNAGDFGGIGTFSTDGSSLTLDGGNLTLGDSDQLMFGDGTDLLIYHDATNSNIASGSGDLIIDNTNATGSSIMRLGTDTAATDFQVQNNSTGVVFTATGAGVVTMGTLSTDGTDVTLNGGDMNIQDSDELRFGDSSDLIIVHGGTDTSITSKTGDLVIDNTNSTGSSIMRLGTDTAATDFQVSNNSGSALLTVDGAGDAILTGNLDTRGDTTSGAYLFYTSSLSSTGTIPFNSFTEFGPRSNLMSNSSGVVTFHTAGTYMISGVFLFSQNSATNGSHRIDLHNSAESIEYQSQSGIVGTTTANTRTQVVLNYIGTFAVNDTVKCVWEESGTISSGTLLNNARNRLNIIKL